MQEANLTISQVAKVAGCHPNTVLNYEQRGYIQPMRDNNNFRRYPLADALRLKEILSITKKDPR
ncbi:MAG: MerR family DNA-binding transcriptional regulator [Deltaproteobacteria bacterium]|nr:MerR family DNA-binding transcriptional regulator [Deltaproteobacteria bacterium]